MKATLEYVDHIPAFPLNMSETVAVSCRMDHHRLVQVPAGHVIADWPADRRAAMVRRINRVARDGGVIVVAKVGDEIAGIASLRLSQDRKGRMQMVTLHVDHGFRRMGIGRSLFEEIERRAKMNDAKGLYISAGPKKTTMDFYVRMGASITRDIDENLFREEPEDIHMEKMWGH